MSNLKLRNGAEAPDVAVRAVMVNLRQVWESNPVAAYELACVCRDRAHEPFSNAGQVLRDLSLLQANGQPHDMVRDVVLSAITGEGFDLHLQWPAEDGA